MTYISKRQRAEKRRKKFKMIVIALTVMVIICIVIYCVFFRGISADYMTAMTKLDIPEYSGQAYVVINGNMPFFDRTDRQMFLKFIAILIPREGVERRLRMCVGTLCHRKNVVRLVASSLPVGNRQNMKELWIRVRHTFITAAI